MIAYFNHKRGQALRRCSGFVTQLNKGQSTLEYAVLIIIIIAALLSIQMYIKRGVQGRLKASTDDIGDQFSPDNTNAVKTTFTNVQTNETFGVAGQGVSKSEIEQGTQENTSTTEKSVILNTQQEYWGVDQ